MRTSILFTFLPLCALAADVAPARQAASDGSSPVWSGPVLGYVAPSGRAELRPIEGTPVTARTGGTVVTPRGVVRLMAGPNASYVLAYLASGDLASLSLPDGRLNRIATGTIRGDTVFFSPRGTSFAVPDIDSGSVRIVTGLPGAPRISWEAAGLASRTLALTTGGEILLAADGGQVILSRSDGSRTSVYRGGHVSAIAVSSDGARAAVMDTGSGQLAIIEDLAGAPSSRTLAQLSGNPGRVVCLSKSVLVTDTSEPAISVIDMATGSVEHIALPEIATAVRNLAGSDAVLLSEPGEEAPGWLLGWADGSPQVWMIPGYPANSTREVRHEHSR